MNAIAPPAVVTARIIRLANAFGAVPAGSPILIAATDAGLTALYAGVGGGSEAALRAELLQRHPGARFAEDDSPFLDQAEDWLRAALAGIPAALPLLDPIGTAFQRAVWDSLSGLPAGTTVTYAGLARRMGRPDATRAVASAIARNEIAIAIPCHRVIGSDGALRGFRWGLEWKRALLELEGCPSR